MPILPIIDLLIFSAWSVISLGAVLKAVYVTTHYRPTVAGLGPYECLMISAILLLLSLALSARTWVKSQESASAQAAARARSTLDAYAEAQQHSARENEGGVVEADERLVARNG